MTNEIKTPTTVAGRPKAAYGLRAAATVAAALAAILALAPPPAVAVLGPGGWSQRLPTAGAAAVVPPPEPVEVPSAARLAKLFDRIGYDLDTVGDGGLPVPSVELAALPADLAEMSSVDARKMLFIQAVLPVVLRANEAVLAERATLEALLRDTEAGAGLAAARDRPADRLARRHRAEVLRIAARYGLPDAAADADGIRRLLQRVDAVPVSLAIAQAISESGWGRSRFARKGNALFGQWTWDPAAGIVPAARAEGRSHRVRAFLTLTDSAHAYLFNLNTHPAYRGFREARAAARAETGGLASGRALAGHLGRYSERRQAYVEDIVGLIRQNRLDRLDAAVLGEPSRYADADPLAAGLVDG